MTVSTTTRFQQYTGDGTSDTFAVPFQFYQIDVYVSGTLKTLGVHYNLTGGNGSTGAVVFTGGNIPANGVFVSIVGSTIIQQPTQYRDFDDAPADLFETSLDKDVMMIAEADLRVRRGIRAAVYNPPLPELDFQGNPSTIIYINDDGEPELREPAAVLAENVAPDGAEYLLAAGSVDLPNSRLVTDTSSILWDLTTPGQAKVRLADMLEATIKGRARGAGTGAPQDLTGSQTADILGLPLNLRLFGAKGDGVTDDTPALNAALAYVAANGGHLYAPAGTYIFTAKETHACVANKHIKIEGAGADVTRFKWTSTVGGIDLTLNNAVTFNGNTLTVCGLSLLTTHATGGGTALRVDGQYTGGNTQPGATIRDLIIAGEDSGKQWSVGLHVHNNQRSTIQNVDLMGRSTLYTFTGVQIDGNNDPTDHLLSNIRVTWAGTALFSTGFVEGFTVDQCTLIACLNGVLFQSTTGDPHFAVTNTHINAAESCIAGVHCLQGFFSSNLLYEWNDGNTSGTWRGIFLTGAATDNNRVYGNQILGWDTGTTKIGIDFDAGSRNCAYQNTIRGFAGFPVTTGIRINAGCILNEYGDNTFDTVTTPVSDAGTNTIGRLNTAGATTINRGVISPVFVPTGSSAPSNGLFLAGANTPAISANSTNVTNFTTNGIHNLPAATTSAGGSANKAIYMGVGAVGIFWGSGIPTLSAAQGSIYLRTDGNSTTTRMYVNTNGTNGWTDMVTGA